MILTLSLADLAFGASTGPNPTFNTNAASAITATSATLSGTVTNTDGATFTEVGVLYCLTSAGFPAEGDPATTKLVGNVANLSPFSVQATGLTASTSYNFRAYIKTTTSGAVGGVLTFTTAAGQPTISFEKAGSTLAYEFAQEGDGSAHVASAMAVPGRMTLAHCFTHVLLLRTDGTVQAFGSGTGTAVPAGLKSVRAVAVTPDSSFALKTDGTVVAWGSGDAALLTPSGLTGVTQLRSGHRTIAALKTNGDVTTWGVYNGGASGLEIQKLTLTGTFGGVMGITSGHAVVSLINGTRVTETPPMSFTGIAEAYPDELARFLMNDGTLTEWTSVESTSFSSGIAPADVALFAGSIIYLRDGRTYSPNYAGGVGGYDNGLTYLGIKDRQYDWETSNLINVFGPKIPLAAQPLATASTAQTVTIRNTGSSDLHLTSVTATGGHAADFSVDTSGMASTVAPGATTTFSFTFTPSAMGRRYTTLRVVSDDPIQAPADIAVAGDVVAPEITIEQPVGTDLVGGRVIAWGNDDAGQSTVPANAQSGVLAVAGGFFQSLALKTDGSVIAWGSDYAGLNTVPPSAQSGVRAIAAHWDHNVALRTDGSVVAWGLLQPDPNIITSNDGDPVNFDLAPVPASQSGVQAIATGAYHIVALKTDGSVIAWGNNDDGQITVPTEAQSGVQAIAAGSFHTVALKSDGSVLAWGQNNNGQTTVPTEAHSGVQAVAAGFYHTLALKSDGSVLAWGDNSRGQATVPVAAQSGVRAITAGAYTSIAYKTDGSVVFWGGGESQPTATVLLGVEAYAFGSMHILVLKRPGIDFANKTVATTSVAKTVTIRNTGTSALTITSASLLGDNTGDFTLNTSAMSSSVAPGESTTVSVSFAPTTAGPRQTLLRIVNNDSDEGTFDINLTGIGTVPEIAVFNGASTDAGDERTDNTGTFAFADTNVGSTSSAQTFTIKNTGTADLTGLAITKTGDFTVTQPAATTLAPDTTTTFTVSFVPTATGTRTGVISIASNDADENPFEINVSGTGVAASPVVTSPTSTIIGGTIASLGGNVTSDSGNSITERGVVFSATATNTDPLIGGTGVTKRTTTGTTGVFTLGAFGLTPNTSYTFKAFATNSVGTGYTATATFTTPAIIVFTDPVLTKINYNTYTLAVEITDDGGSPITERGILWNDNLFADPQVNDPGVHKVTSPGTTGAFTLTATNLTPSSGHSMIAYAINGNGTFYSHHVNFSTTGPPPTMYSFQSATPGATTATLSGQVMSDNGSSVTEEGVVFAPTSVNADPKIGGTGVTKTARSSPTMNEFSVEVTGLTPGTAYSFRAYGTNAGGSGYSALGTFTTLVPPGPEIAVFNGANTDAANERTDNTGTFSFADTNIGTTSAAQTFTIKNTGTANLTDLALSFSSQSSKDFSFTAPTVTTLAAGETTTFTVSFAPAVSGTTSATLRIASNDTDENPFDINFTGTAIAGAPRVVIEQAGGLPLGGYPVAWGTNLSGQMDIPWYLTNVKQVATGRAHTLALQTNGYVSAFGYNERGERSIPSGLSGVASIAAGDYLSVAVKGDGTVVAWGDDSSGAVTALSAMTNVKAVSAHDNSSWVVLKTDGSVVSGGNAGTLPADLPVIKAVACGQHHALALTEDGHVRAWASSNDNGEANVPEGLANVIAIAAGLEHSMALKQDGTVVVWGGARASERGLPEGLAGVTGIECGEQNCFAIKADGTVTAWGPDLFYGTNDVPALPNAESVAASFSHAVAVVGGFKFFGEQRVGIGEDLRSFFVHNTGDAPLSVTDVSIIGQNPGDFSLTAQPTAPIAPGETGTFTVRFAPTASGQRMAKVRFLTNDATRPVVNVAFTGVAIDPKPPTGQDRVLSLYEDTSIYLDSFTFGFDDSAQSPQDAPAGIKIVTLPEHGTLWTDDGEVTEAGVTVPNWNGLRYRPAPNSYGGPFDSFTFQLADAGPEDVRLSTVHTATFNVLPSSEPPEGTDKTITVAPNGRHVFTPEEFGFSDPNDTPPNHFKSVIITQLPEAGGLWLNGKLLGFKIFGIEAAGFGEQPDGTEVNIQPVPGKQWTYHGPEHDWQAIASSADGSKLIAAGSLGTEVAQLYTSTDGGTTWNPSGTEGNYYAVASSANGSVLYATHSHYYQTEGPPSGVLKSTDGGENWAELSLTGDDIWALACSANGQVIAAMDGGVWTYFPEVGYLHSGGGLQLSADGGQTFTMQLEGKELMGVDCSADGQTIVAISNHNFFISHNGGSTWNAEFESESNDYNWRAITCSADGQHIFIATGDDGIRVSHDSGTTWTDEGASGYFFTSIACSDDGKIVVATPDSGYLQMSTDGGQTWVDRNSWRNWLCSAVSGDGSRLFAGSQQRSQFGQESVESFTEGGDTETTDGRIAISAATADELVYVPDSSSFGLTIAGGPGASSDGFIFHVVDDGDPAGNTDLSGNFMNIEFGDRLADPTFTNLAVSNITPTSATLSANLVNEAGAFVTDLGFEYRQITSETTYNYTTYADAMTQSGPFSGSVPDVLTGYPVIYRAFAVLSDGSSVYSEEGSFVPAAGRPVAVGNLVFWDKNNNGHADAGEGVDGVTVQLYSSTQEVGASTPLRTTTTADGGFWFIDNLVSGQYRLHIPKSMFATSAPLWKMKSVEGFMTTGDDDVGEKGQDASEPEESGARTEVFTLIAGSAPTGELGLTHSEQTEARDIDIDLTRDLGFVDRTEKTESFDKWKQRNGGGSGDDHKDLINYALGGDGDGDTTTHFDVEDNHQTGRTHIHLRRRHGSQPDVTYTVQVCPDLSGASGTWEGTTIIPTIVNNGDGTETVTFPDVTTDPALQGFQLGFTRLLVTLRGSDGSVLQTSISDLLGWQHRQLAIRNQTYGLPFVRPAAFTSTVASTNGQSITLPVGSDVAAALLANEHYYVEVIKGDQEGQRYEVNESATTATGIVLDLTNPLSTQTTLPATLDGDTIAVRPHWRVKDLFPVADFTASSNANSADQIQIWVPDTSSYITLYLLNHPTQGRIWVRVADLTYTSQNERVLGPADGLFAKPRQAVIAAANGQVRTWKFACPLRAGTNFIGNPYPVDQSFSDRLMSQLSGFTGSNNPNNADKVYIWTGDAPGSTTTNFTVYYLNVLPGFWSKAGSIDPNNYAGDKVFGAGFSSFINCKVAAPNWIMPSPIAP